MAGRVRRQEIVDREITDPYWLQPLREDQRTTFYNETAGNLWTMTIEAGAINADVPNFHKSIGWTKVTSLTIGRAVDHDFERAQAESFESCGLFFTTPAPNILLHMAAIAAEAEFRLEAYEETRRVRVLLDMIYSGGTVDIAGTRVRTNKKDLPRDYERKVAAAIYNLVVSANKTNPGPLINDHLGISDTKRKQLLTEAEERGWLNRLPHAPTKKRSSLPATRRKKATTPGKEANKK